MSLKAFHLLFITAASALSFGCAVWAFTNYADEAGNWVDLVSGVGAICAGIGLMVYERFFLKKTRNIGYL